MTPLREPADVKEEQESVCDEALKELCPFQIIHLSIGFSLIRSSFVTDDYDDGTSIVILNRYGLLVCLLTTLRDSSGSSSQPFRVTLNFTRLSQSLPSAILASIGGPWCFVRAITTLKGPRTLSGPWPRSRG